jgi:hypothetical protein
MPGLRIIVGLSWLLALALATAETQRQQDLSSHVKNNTFVSADNPTIRVKVDRRFEYIGSVPFTVGDAGGNRYVFVRSTGAKHIDRMFIIQQEGFSASSNDTYKYRITSPAKLGKFEYQHSVIMEDNDATIREEPGKESDLTRRFLAAHGYVLEPELVMSRFARPADLQHKHEIIFFCFENLSTYRHKLADFPEGSDNPEKQEIERKVDQDCRNTFHVNR